MRTVTYIYLLCVLIVQASEDPVWIKSNSASCPTGSNYITDESTCAQAAVWAGYEDITRVISNPSRPMGCYIASASNDVWLNTGSTLTSATDSTRTMLCSVGAVPITSANVGGQPTTISTGADNTDIQISSETRQNLMDYSDCLLQNNFQFNMCQNQWDEVTGGDIPEIESGSGASQNSGFPPGMEVEAGEMPEVEAPEVEAGELPEQPEIEMPEVEVPESPSNQFRFPEVANGAQPISGNPYGTPVQPATNVQGGSVLPAPTTNGQGTSPSQSSGENIATNPSQSQDVKTLVVCNRLEPWQCKAEPQCAYDTEDMKCQGLDTGFLENACGGLVNPARCNSNIFCNWNGASCVMTDQEAEGSRICAAQLDTTMCQKKAMCTFVGGMCMLKEVVKIEAQLACSAALLQKQCLSPCWWDFRIRRCMEFQYVENAHPPCPVYLNAESCYSGGNCVWMNGFCVSTMEEFGGRRLRNPAVKKLMKKPLSNTEVALIVGSSGFVLLSVVLLVFTRHCRKKLKAYGEDTLLENVVV